MVNISVENLILQYPKKSVLCGLSASFESGKINILMGENGAGKSSLIKIICGDILPDSGKIIINGEEVKIRSAADGIKKGIVCVHQRPILADSISILENLSLGVKKFDRKKAEEELSKWLPRIKASLPVKNCSGEERFFISLSGALLKKPEVLILDEPSALLNLEEREYLFNKLRDFAQKGMNIIVISHYIDEAEKYGDRVTCLDNGKVLFSLEKGDSRLKEKLSELKKAIPSENKTREHKSPLYLSFKNLTSIPKDKAAVRDFSFSARGGEITLIYGQAEDGRDTLEDIITGMNFAGQKGFLEINDDRRSFSYTLKKGNFTRRTLEKSPFKFGIIPSDKNFRGANPGLTIEQLLTTMSSKSKDRDYSLNLIKKADVKILPEDKVSMLSGGMLQRLILEREIAKNPDILIMCEPLQGLDSERSRKVFEEIRKIADRGKIVIVLAAKDFPGEICEKIYRLEKSLNKKEEKNL